MQIVRGYRDVPAAARGATLGIGNFDGVHHGHQALLAETRRLAPAATPHGAIIFEPHPRRFFQPDKPLFEISPLEIKLDLLARYGASLVVVLPFDLSLAGLAAEAFIEDVLVRGLGVRRLVAGYDFQFGKGRSGNTEMLLRAADGGGLGVTIVQPVTARVGSALIVASSSGVRAALTRGDVAGAASLLGHWWRISGMVTGGAKRGTGMGYPTANVVLPAGCDLALGIYAARVHVDDIVHAGAAYLGTRPTFDNGRPVLETFLLDFDGDLYGKTIAVEFIARLRGDQAFPDMPTLVAQMDHDVAAARLVLADLDRHDPTAWPPAYPRR